MEDGCGREINYLRISVTERCNQHCVYCMPAVPKGRPCEGMPAEDIIEVVQQAVPLGFTKFRLTGGEPLMRPDILRICEGIAETDGVQELTMTTNAQKLGEMAADLKHAGLQRVNISLDTLDSKKYRRISGGNIREVLQGMEAAYRSGLTPIKINAVLLGGINDDEIYKMVELTRSCPLELRFIELMPIGPAAHFPKNRFLPCSAVLDAVQDLIPVSGGETGGVARMYQLPGGKGKVGLISPLSCEFCDRCNRIRLTADGCLKPCLHSNEEIRLRGLRGQQLQWALKLAIAHKPERHGELDAQHPSPAARAMNQIGG